MLHIPSRKGQDEVRPERLPLRSAFAPDGEKQLKMTAKLAREALADRIQTQLHADPAKTKLKTLKVAGNASAKEQAAQQPKLNRNAVIPRPRTISVAGPSRPTWGHHQVKGEVKTHKKSYSATATIAPSRKASASLKTRHQRNISVGENIAVPKEGIDSGLKVVLSGTEQDEELRPIPSAKDVEASNAGVLSEPVKEDYVPRTPENKQVNFHGLGYGKTPISKLLLSIQNGFGSNPSSPEPPLDFLPPLPSQNSSVHLKTPLPLHMSTRNDTKRELHDDDLLLQL
jgi:hypothetical protein